MSAGTRAWFLVALSSAALAGCGSSLGDPNATDGPDPLVGAWTYSSRPPDPVAINLALNADKTFTFVEEVAPFGYPAGVVPVPGCATTHTFLGTYAEAVSGGAPMLLWTYTGGTVNAILRCDDPSHDSVGTPVTAEDIAVRIADNGIPPMTVGYTVTSTTLVLAYSWVVGGSTTLTKSP